MIKFLQHLAILFSFFCIFYAPFSQAECTFSGDIRKSFELCNPSIGIRAIPNVDMKVDKDKSDFRTIVTDVVERVQKVAAVVAIGFLIWIGLILAFPFKEAAKEGAKGKVLSVLVGFLLVIGTTLLVNGLIKLTYEFFP